MHEPRVRFTAATSSFVFLRASYAPGSARVSSLLIVCWVRTPYRAEEVGMVDDVQLLFLFFSYACYAYHASATAVVRIDIVIIYEESLRPEYSFFLNTTDCQIVCPNQLDTFEVNRGVKRR
jgi:hypothetical protein